MKRSVSLLLVLLLGLPFVPFRVSAAARTVTLKTPQDLIDLSKNCVLDSWSAYKTVVLENDIDISGTAFSPIPLFAGQFDGGGHTVSGFAFEHDGTVTGFFRRITESGSVENLRISGCVSAGSRSATVGGFVGENQGVIKNCSFTGDVSGCEAIGGFCGVNALSGVLDGVTASGTVRGQHRVGGIAGENNGVIRSCRNLADVNTDVTEKISTELSEFDWTRLDLTRSAEDLVDITDIGGVAGFSSGALRRCTNEGPVGHRYVGYNVGGIVGRLSGYADSCENSGKVYGRKDVGGIAGQMSPDTSWDASAQTLSALKEKLEALRGSIHALTADVSSHSEALSERLGSVTDSLSGVNEALDSIAEDAESFVNENISTVNELSGRLTQTLTQFQPFFASAESFLADLPGIFDRLTQLIDELSEASVITGETYTRLKSEIQTAAEAVGRIRAAISGIREKLSAFLSSHDLNAAKELLCAIRDGMSTVRTEFQTAKTAVGSILSTLRGITRTHQALTEALNAAAQTSERIDAAFSSLGSVETQLSDAYDVLAGYDKLSFSSLHENSSARGRMFSSVSDAYAAFRSIAAELAGTWLEEDVNAVSNDFIDLIQLMLDTVSGLSAVSAEISDISSDVSEHRNGVIRDCRNGAEITAENSGGGIAGAISIDVSFDLEDEFQISALLTDGMKYLVYARISACENEANVHVKKDAAGGIVGRMDYGTLCDCRAGGSITVNGAYAGGIVGISEGTVEGCISRVNLSAQRYVGGIAGKGKNVSGCLCIPNLQNDCACMGAIAGDADGEISGNYYAQCETGGVNGFSRTGQAEPVKYEKLMHLSGNAPLFRVVTVTFVAGGETAGIVEVPFGGQVGALPEIPDRDGKHWRWDEFDNTAITGSLTVEGSYQSPVTVLSSGGEIPQFLVEGVFTDRQELTVSAASEVYTLRVNDCEGPLTVRARMTDDCDLLVADDTGAYRKTSYLRDGSYIVFPLENGGCFTFWPGKSFGWLYILIAAAAAVLITAFGIRMRKRKKRRES